jgi:hypothetical protein
VSDKNSKNGRSRPPSTGDTPGPLNKFRFIDMFKPIYFESLLNYIIKYNKLRNPSLNFEPTEK